MREKDSGWRMAIKAFAILSGAGIYLCVFIGIFLYLGHLADAFFGTGNKAKLVFLILSMPAAFYTLYRQLKTQGVV